MNDSENKSAFIGMLGLLVLNITILKFVAYWLVLTYPGLPATVLGSSIAAAMPGYVFSLKTRPEGWPGWLRLTAGTLLLTGIALLAWLLFGLATGAALPPDYKAAHGAKLHLISFIPVFLLMFPLAAGLGRIGLLPGFRWNVDEAPAGPPAWYPPGAGRRLPTIIALIAVAAIGPGAMALLAQAWPDSALPLLKPLWVSILLVVGGVAGYFHAPKTGWAAPLGATLLGVVAMGAVTAGIALLLPLLLTLWPDPRAGTATLLVHALPALVLLPFLVHLARREYRRGRGRWPQGGAGIGVGWIP